MPGPQALHLPGPPRGRATSALALRRRSDRLLALTDAVVAVAASYACGVLLHRDITVSWAGYALVSLTTVLTGRWLGLYRRAALRPGSALLEPAVGTALAGAAAAVVVVADVAAGAGVRLGRAGRRRPAGLAGPGAPGRWRTRAARSCRWASASSGTRCSATRLGCVGWSPT